jgi:hypothetical protein
MSTWNDDPQLPSLFKGGIETTNQMLLQSKIHLKFYPSMVFSGPFVMVLTVLGIGISVPNLRVRCLPALQKGVHGC